MKKSIVNYNNIKLSVPSSNEPKTETVVNKRIIFKSKPQKTNPKENDFSQKTHASTENSDKKTKIVLKRTLKEKSDEYNFDKSLDSDEEIFNVFDLDKKTSQLSLKKQKNDSSPSSSSTSSFSSSFLATEVSPKFPKISPTIKTKKIDLKSPDLDEEVNLAKKIKVVKTDNNIADLEAKLKKLDEDDDFEIDVDKVKKFKLIKKPASDTRIESNNETKSNLVIKNKIFSSKTRSDESGKLTKISSFKLNFNETDDKSETDEENEAVNIKKSFTKTNSLQPSKSSEKTELMPRSQSFNPKIDKKDFDSTLVVNIRNTRKAYECEELGEAQAFQDDFDYLLDGLNSKHKLSERCLSSIKLAECCQSSEFRMNLRSSVSNDGNNIHKIFKLLTDAANYKSLSLCTTLIIFTLTQDNLSIDIDDSTFSLILSFLQFNEKNNSIKDLSNDEIASRFKYLDDFPNMISHSTSQANGSQSNEEINLIDANNDLVVYKKIYSKCKKIYHDVSTDSLTKECQELHEIQFNCGLLSLDCLLNMNQNMKKNIVQNNFYKNELREKFIIDKILIRSRLLIKSLKDLNEKHEFEFKQNEQYNSIKCLFLLNKLKSCINLIETLTQPATHSNSGTKNLKAIKCKDSDPLESNERNQNYLMDLKNRFTLDFIKDSLNFFKNQINQILDESNKMKSNSENKEFEFKILNCYVNVLKEYFLLLISITQNNEYVSRKFLSDKELINILLTLLINEPKSQSILFKLVNENDQFDLLIMLLGVLLNLFVNCFNDKILLNLTKYKNKEVNMTALDIVLKLYQMKENLVIIAENDQENEFNQLNEHIESQNIENINVAIMNSIHKAGKHMEDHIIAAHSGLIIGYMLFIDDSLNSGQFFKIDSVQMKLKNKAFKSMIQIIRKFIVFMKMMKVSGFSAEKYLEMVLEFLDRLEN